MKEVIIHDKQKYFNEHCPFTDIPKLNETRTCLHCGEMITIGDYKVYRDEEDGFEYICCPSAPRCDGTIIDWVSVQR